MKTRILIIVYILFSIFANIYADENTQYYNPISKVGIKLLPNNKYRIYTSYPRGTIIKTHTIDILFEGSDADIRKICKEFRRFRKEKTGTPIKVCGLVIHYDDWGFSTIENNIRLKVYPTKTDCRRIVKRLNKNKKLEHEKNLERLKEIGQRYN